MAAPEKSRNALQLIFAFFLGLMVTAFIGVGVYTFHGPPGDPADDPTRELRDQQQAIRDARGPEGLTEEQQTELARLGDEIRAMDERARESQQSWARTTSIVLIILATMVMGVSLIRADQLPVINNGLLLGGVFTMLYGTGWTLASGDSQLRFWVMAFALLITLALGYVRFVRERRLPENITLAGSGGEVGDLTERLAALERRVDAAADAMKRES
jgi:hypothetical protein